MRRRKSTPQKSRGIKSIRDFHMLHEHWTEVEIKPEIILFEQTEANLIKLS